MIGATFLKFTLASAGLSRKLTPFMEGLKILLIGFILMVVSIHITMGHLIKTLSVIFLTILTIVQTVLAQGYDVNWFSILMFVLIKIVLITPPVGLNLYVVQGARKTRNLNKEMLGALPYWLTMLLMACLLIASANIAIFLQKALQ